MTRIVEIGEIAWQGQTNPVFCRADDGNEDVVKGAFAGRKSLIGEWVAGGLAQLLELPVPNFALMKIDPALNDFSVKRRELELLGTGTLFGSLRVPHALEIRQNDLLFIDSTLQARVLAFDWWIANPDRILIEGSGNPNLLWVEHEQSLVVMDHNLAFEAAMMGDFWSEHPFRGARNCWTSSFRHRMELGFKGALSGLRRIWNELPEDWVEFDGEPSFLSIEELLWRFERERDTFWRLA